MTQPKLLVGSDALGWTNAPNAVNKVWSHGQHGPGAASFSVPYQPYEALDPRLRCDQECYIIVNGVCRWSGRLGPVSSGKSDGSFLEVSAVGTFERGKHDESYCKTIVDGDESRWTLRKGSSQRFTIEADGTLIIRAEGGGSNPTNWKSGRKAELIYVLNDGLGDPSDTISFLSFIWNIDLATAWTTYVDAYTDAYDGYKISRIWSKTNLTGSGEVPDLACPAGTRALMFGLVVGADRQLDNDVFAELSDVKVTGVGSDLLVSDVMKLVADELSDGVDVSDVEDVGDPLDDFVWRYGDGSRSYLQEQVATFCQERIDWRWAPPVAAPGDDRFIVRAMPTTPDNRSRWYSLDKDAPGVTSDISYQELESMDIASLVYSRKDGNLLAGSSPSSLTTDWPSDLWSRSSTNVTVADSYSGYAADSRSYVSVCNASDYVSSLSAVEASGYGVPVIAGASYNAGVVVERLSATWPTGPDYVYAWFEVLWYQSDGSYISTDWLGSCADIVGEDGLGLTSQGAVNVLGRNTTPPVAPAGAAFALVRMRWDGATGGTGAIGWRSVHFDTDAPGGTLATSYYPSAPVSVDQRVRIFDYSGDNRMTATAAYRTLRQIWDWYGVADAERDREPLGTITVRGPFKTIDGSPAYPYQVQTGDWVTLHGDLGHESWPVFVSGADISDDGNTVAFKLGGDGGDFNYVGRSEPPSLQKRKRRRGRHHRVLYRVWYLKNLRKEYADYLRRSRPGHREWKTFAAYKKAHPMPKKHPKWGPE